VADLARSLESSGDGEDTDQMTGEIMSQSGVLYAASGPAKGAPRPLKPGDAVGRYVISSLLGAGGMGVVFLARDPTLNRKVTLKLLHAERQNQRSAQVELLREAQSLAQLSHPNVVSVYDAGAFNDQVFMAMEFVEGATMHDWLLAQPRSWMEVLSAFQEAGRGLAAAHAVGIVHRDFKPRNVLVGKDGRVRVVDFGLARAAVQGETDTSGVLQRVPSIIDSSITVSLTETGALKGTPAYMAPEQFRGEGADARADQFAFCVSLYDGFYGERPFQSTDVGQLVVSVLAGKVRPPPSVDSLPAGLRACLLRGLHVDPAQRFASMNELLDALDAERAKATAAPTIKIRSVAPPATPKGRWIVVGATALSAGLVVGALLVLRGGSSGVTAPNLPASSVAAPGSSAVAAVLPSVGSESPPQVTAASSASAQVAPSVSASAAPRASALAVPSAKAGLAKGKPTSGPSARPPRYDDAPMEPSFVRKK
jgi:serine/threonine protein kinase